MSITVRGRLSESPYVKTIWESHFENDYIQPCPADSHWNLTFVKNGSSVQISIERPIAITRKQKYLCGSEVLSIQFRFGVFLPLFSKESSISIQLPLASNQSFWLNGSTWDIPNFDNIESFVQRLIREEILVQDSLIHDIQKRGYTSLSDRTLRRRYIMATGLTPKTVEQIQRAQQAAIQLEYGMPILDVSYATGYSDQPHLTRSLKRFTGKTPLEMTQMSKRLIVQSLPENFASPLK